uniref:Uncharacterized protein n=1 Tax=Rhipicephalus zambeziensis TaxID=60191 RepID=A0A224YH93_9ACAR
MLENVRHLEPATNRCKSTSPGQHRSRQKRTRTRETFTEDVAENVRHLQPATNRCKSTSPAQHRSRQKRTRTRETFTEVMLENVRHLEPATSRCKSTLPAEQRSRQERTRTREIFTEDALEIVRHLQPATEQCRPTSPAQHRGRKKRARTRKIFTGATLENVRHLEPATNRCTSTSLAQRQGRTYGPVLVNISPMLRAKTCGTTTPPRLCTSLRRLRNARVANNVSVLVATSPSTGHHTYNGLHHRAAPADEVSHFVSAHTDGQYRASIDLRAAFGSSRRGKRWATFLVLSVARTSRLLTSTAHFCRVCRGGRCPLQ